MTPVELAVIAVGVTFLVLGLASLIADALRPRRRRVGTLLTFGCWCGLYGARLLASQPTIRTVIGGDPHRWMQFAAIVTYSINIPITAFLASLIGAGWRNSARWLLVAVSAFAGIAIVADLLTGTVGIAMSENSGLVLTIIPIGLVNIVYSATTRGVRTPLGDPIVIVGGLILLLFVVNENVGGPLSRGLNIEPIGVLLFILCLGYALGRSIFRAEAEFLTVQRELEMARNIQLSLLPQRIPKPRALDVAVRYVPMSAVAGDIYDVIEIGPAAIGILVADVMGHGMPAALVASMVKLAFSVQTSDARDPARVLESMNAILCGQVQSSYASAVYAVVDTDTGRITVASAGHPPALILRHGESLAEVAHEHGLILGFLPGASYANMHFDRLARGDRLLLYSDGVLEARDRSGQFFDGDRVANWLTSIRSANAEEFAATALAELGRWSDRSQFDDDVTFVIIEVSDPIGSDAIAAAVAIDQSTSPAC
jgi:sigma-B regulation protein RsbU (phosphoserine phosphatase)